MSAIAIQIDTNAARVLRDWQALPARVQGPIRAAVARELLLARQDVVSRAGIRWKSGARGLQGRLATYVTANTAFGLDGGIGFRRTKGFPYELSQEFGARAKPGRAMSIPVTDKARKTGSPRNFPGKLFIPKKKHVLCEAVFGKNLPGGHSFVVHYILVKSLKPRLGFRSALTGLGERVSRAIRQGLKEGV